MKKFSLQTLAIALCLSQSGAAFGHDFWIEPDRFILEAPGEVQLTLREGVDLKGNSLAKVKSCRT